MKWRGSKEVGAEVRERELTKGVWGAVRKPGHPWPSGGGVQVAIPLPSGSAWELGARFSPPEGNH